MRRLSLVVDHQETIMSGDKRKTPKLKSGSRKGGVKAFGVAGALSLATCICGDCKASASTTSAGNMPSSPRLLLAEEEISDVSLSTFYAFDKEGAHPGVRFAAGGHGGGGGGCGGHGGGCGGHGGGCGGGHGCGAHGGCGGGGGLRGRPVWGWGGVG